MSPMPTPIASVRPEPFGGYRHTRWLPLPLETDLDAATGPLCPYVQTWVEFEPVSDGGWMLAVVLHADTERLSSEDEAALSGETAEAWARANV